MPPIRLLMRAFIFSLDAFVAFMVALVAIYSLIFFSSVPSAYYSMLTQAHYLSRDTLLALSTTTCTADVSDSCYIHSSSVLDNLASSRVSDSRKDGITQETVGNMIPNQFGYRLEVSKEDGSWDSIYDTADADDGHANVSKKLTVTTQVFTFGFSNTLNKPSASVFNYLSCGGDRGGAGGPQEGTSWGTSTCGVWTGGASGPEGRPVGNTNPNDYMGTGTGLVPTPQVKVVRLTVFI